MPTFRKKPVEIEAFKLGTDPMPDWYKCSADVHHVINDQDLSDPLGQFDHAIIKTLEGDHRANVGDYIIKGVKGELYPCKPDIFEMTYEPVET